MSDTQNPMEFLKSLWGPLGVPLPGMLPPIFDANELARRIADLKAVEHWMNLNLSVLRSTIQGLELQKAALDAAQAMAVKAQDMAGGPAASGVPSMEAWWNVLQGQMPKNDAKK